MSTDSHRRLTELRKLVAGWHAVDATFVLLDRRSLDRAERLLELFLDAGYGEPLLIIPLGNGGVRMEWANMVVDTRPNENGDEQPR